MKDRFMISGFADEISADFDEQLSVLNKLGIKYLSLRTADGKGIGEYTVEEAREKLLKRLEEAGVKVSSIGSPIGKVGIEDEEGFQNQKEMLERLCQIAKLFDCRYIRMFSFYIPEGKDAFSYREQVMEKSVQFLEIAKKHGVVLLHENEKDIYGDTGERCKELIETMNSEYYRGIFDFANFVQCGEDTSICYDLLRPYIDYIHIKDAVYSNSENVVCGTGDGKIPELLEKFYKSGYEGFLTLEPHLVLFDALKDLETKDPEEIIKEKKQMTNEEGYTLQYEALVKIIDAIQA